MTHTIVELEHCQVLIKGEQIEIWTKNPKGELILVLGYCEFDEVLEAVARTEKFLVKAGEF